MPIDPNILLAAKGIDVPSPFQMASQGMTLADLASQNAVRNMALRAAQRKDAAAAALGQVLPALAQGGFSDAAVQAALSHPAVLANPDAAPDILTRVEAYQKAQADLAK